AALWKGFKEFQQLGLIETLPRLIGVQAAGADPIHKAWQTGKEELTAVIPKTLADSIAVGTPRNWRKALRAIIESNGVFITVSDEEILAGMRLLGKECGVFAEPAAAAAVAGAIASRREGILTPASEIVIVITGNGLKDTASAIRATTGKAHYIKPDFSEVLLRVKSTNYPR
ncbi:MAG: pyridoxal-phosphate dependent enzyme, partial [Candidatus Sumerlaeia bacterium]|nr:pyridoxal-phosphate dependent enzyme [Candidatus Sumerlaeia bacterium]